MLKQVLKSNESRLKSAEKENTNLKSKYQAIKSKSDEKTIVISKMLEILKEKKHNLEEIRNIIEPVQNEFSWIETYEDADSFSSESIKIKVKNLKENDELLESSVILNKIEDDLEEEKNHLQINKKQKPAKSKEEIQNEIEKRIQNQIATRSRRGKELLEINKRRSDEEFLSDSSKNNPNQKMMENPDISEFDLENIRKKVEKKCEALNAEIFESEEKKNINSQIQTANSVENLFLYIWNFFEFKSISLFELIKVVKSERGNFFLIEK